MLTFISRNLYLTLFLVSFVLLYLLGPVVSLLINRLGFHKEFDGAVVGQAAIFLFLFVSSLIFLNWFTRVRGGVRSVALWPRQSPRYKRAIYFLPLGISLASILVYFLKNGLVLRVLTSYEDRYLANVGLGAFSLGMQFFYVFVAGLLIVRRQTSFSTLIFIAGFYALVTFVVLGGHRQLGLGLVVGLLIYFSLERRVPLSVFWLSLASFIPISLAMALLRYDMELVTLKDFCVSLLVFFYDGLTPLDAHTNIYLYLEHFDPPGIGVALNQFLAYVPRFIWSDKPQVLLNGGNFYTFAVLGRSGLVTYSPTMLGELMLVHGAGYLLAAPALAVIIHRVDRIASRRDLLGVTFMLFSFTLCFNLYREGFYVFVSKVVILFVFVRLFETVSRFRVGVRSV